MNKENSQTTEKQTIAQFLNIKEFPFIIKNENGKVIYCETSDHYWWKKEYDKYDRELFLENSSKFWWKREYDNEGNQRYYEDSDGVIIGMKNKSKEPDSLHGKTIEIDGKSYVLQLA